MTKRRTYRVNADSWMVLKDILVGTPEDFNSLSDSLKGYADTSPMWGKLPEEWITRMRNDKVTYVIYSYNTPIAWKNAKGEWVVPNVRYSVTTSKHQGKVQTALSQISGGIDNG